MTSPGPNNGLSSLNISFILSGNGKSSCAYLHQKKSNCFAKFLFFPAPKSLYIFYFIDTSPQP